MAESLCRLCGARRGPRRCRATGTNETRRPARLPLRAAIVTDCRSSGAAFRIEAGAWGLLAQGWRRHAPESRLVPYGGGLRRRLILGDGPSAFGLCEGACMSPF